MDKTNAEFSGPMAGPFPIDPVLTAIAVAYKNERLIADEVLPVVPVGVQNFKYRKYAAEDSFTVPDTLVGRKGKLRKWNLVLRRLTVHVKTVGLKREFLSMILRTLQKDMILLSEPQSQQPT